MQSGKRLDSVPAARQDLSTRQPISETTVHGRQSLLIGLGLMGFSTLYAVLAHREWGFGSEQAPWLGVAFLGIVALAGASFARHGWRGMRHEKRIALGAARHPEQPWLWDYEWDPRNLPDRAGGDGAKAVRVGVVSILFLAPFHWIGLTVDGAGVFLVFALLLDLVFLALLGYGVFLLVRQARYRGVRLHLATHPFYLGRELVAELVGLPREMGEITATLRCVQEEYVERRTSGGKKTRSIVSRVLHEEERSAPSSQPRFTFPLPEGDYETRLRERPPRYWELETAGSADGLDFRSRYLVPVYADSTRRGGLRG